MITCRFAPIGADLRLLTGGRNKSRSETARSGRGSKNNSKMEETMSTFVLPLADPNATLEIVGGKGLSLAKLARAGLPVPDGFHVTTAAYRSFVAENQIQPQILAAIEPADTASPASLESISRWI